jgi:pimeloyl-ACP methyl ester carboxylesterase
LNPAAFRGDNRCVSTSSLTLDAWRASGARVRLANGLVFVRSEGEGPALLFLHGFPTTSFDFAPIVARLAKHHRCVAFDFAGFGESDPPARYDCAVQADLALEVAAHADVERAIVVAHDYGSTIAQELLARAPSSLRIDGVVFMNGGLHPKLHRPLPIQRLLAGPAGRFLAPLLVRKSTFVRSMRRALVRHDRFDFSEHWRAICAHGAQRRTHDLLHYIADRRRCEPRWSSAFSDSSPRIGLAWGTRDPISGAHVLEWARRHRPDADVLALDVGHYPQVEAPDEVAAFIERFASAKR